jgi:hypothetical protein
MNDELEKMCNEAIMAYSRHHRICLNEVKKTTTNISQDDRSPVRYLNQRPPNAKHDS